MKKLFSVKTITAFILVLTMAMLLPVQTVASATVGKYVSELCYVKNMQTLLCYTTTHDPKRAMYMSVKTRKSG